MKLIHEQRAVLPKELGERGIALVVTLLVISLLTLVGVTFLTLSVTENTIAYNEVHTTRAFNVAEAGLAHARRELITANVNAILASNPPLITFTAGGQNVIFAGGTYSVTVSNNTAPTFPKGAIPADPGGATTDTDGIIVTTSTGTYRNASRTVEALLGPGIPAAITTEKDLTIPGNPTIGGTLGSVHTNSDLTISGNPDIFQDATASGTYSASGNPTIGGKAQGGVPAIPLPVIDPAAYLPRAEYILKADGTVVDAPTAAVVFDSTTGNSWPTNNGGWKRSSGPPQVKWEWGGNAITNFGAESIFYVEGDAQVSANPGSTADPWDVTIIATGHIDISGNPTARAKDADGLLFVAGTDVKISGNPAISYEGIILANEQFQMSGNLSFTGFAIARDETSTDPFIVNNAINGNPTITYDGAPAPLADLFPIRVLSWREMAY